MTNEHYGFFTKEEYEKLREEKGKRQKADMTREEAIEKLELMRQKVDEETYRALVLAIKALEQNESAEEWYKLFVEKLDEQEPCNGTVLRKGKWTNNQNGTYECDKCGCKHSRSNYCPSCGCRMESEDKECHIV